LSEIDVDNRNLDTAVYIELSNEIYVDIFYV